MKRLAVVGSLLFLAGVGYVGYMVARLPDVSYLKKTNPTVPALMEQRAREKRSKPQTIRTWVSLKVYDPQLRERLKQAGEYCGIQLCESAYGAIVGPTYETPAEIRFLRTIGGDAVGMSTVPEAIVAKHMGMKAAGLSMLANVAAGISGKPVNHAEVLEVVAQTNADVGMLLQRFFDAYES